DARPSPPGRPAPSDPRNRGPGGPRRTRRSDGGRCPRRERGRRGGRPPAPRRTCRRRRGRGAPSPAQLDDAGGGVGVDGAVPGGGSEVGEAGGAVLVRELLVDGEVGDAVPLRGGAGERGIGRGEERPLG